MPSMIAIALGASAVAVLAAMLAAFALAHERRARATLARRIESLERDHRAACGAEAEVGDRLLEVEQQVRALVHGQTQLEMKAPASESYRHAITLVERGASTEDLVSRCGLARGEAELVHLIHAAAAARAA